MNEKPNQFPLPNPAELIEVTITSDLRKAGIKVQEYGRKNNNITVTTDEEVPEDKKSSYRQDAENDGFTIKFLTSE